MELQEVRVENFKSIEDSNWVELEDVTCMIGKNESGKTAFLEALRKFNPVNGDSNYNHKREYPRKKLSEYLPKHSDNPERVVSLKFELDELEKDEIEELLGPDVLQSDQITVKKKYDNSKVWWVDLDEEKAVENILQEFDLSEQIGEKLEDIEEFSELKESLSELDDAPNDLEQRVGEFGDSLSHYLADEVLHQKLPSFFYFSEYSIMDGKVNIQQLKQRKSQNNLSESDETFMDLLSRANLSIEDLETSDDYELVKASLEASSNSITDDIEKYWSQSDHLEVEFDKSESSPADNTNSNSGFALEVRVKNTKHRVSVPFNQRSSGFIWFFSFLAKFSQIKNNEDGEVILLLDEPGLNLHAEAQNDFLNFIDEELAPKHQVIYTTHSPFMVNPHKIHRTRIVEDKDKKDDEDDLEGTKVTSEFLKTDKESVFPLQGVLGYDLINTLFLGPQCLLLEGKSDMIYIQIISDILNDRERTSLSHKWTLVPVGGADNIPTFVSLFAGNELDLGIFMDDDDNTEQKLEQISDRDLIDMDSVKTVTDYVNQKGGDIEDMFTQKFYLDLLNSTYSEEIDNEFGRELEEDDIGSEKPRIIQKFEDKFSGHDIGKEIATGKFNHKEPAIHLQKNLEEFRNEIDDETLDRFEELFEELNSLIQ